MNSSTVKKQRSTSLYIILPMIIGLHIGWFVLQQRYVPITERHDHPLVKLYKKFST
jgi:lipopolysaccharide export system protein LptC